MTPEPKVEQGFIELWKNDPVSLILSDPVLVYRLLGSMTKAPIEFSRRHVPFC